MLFIVDATELISTLHFARVEDRSIDNTLEMFRQRLDYLWDMYSPKYPDCHFICVFDNESVGWRKRVYPQYKSGRVHEADEMETRRAAVDVVRNSQNWACMIAPEGYEGDDLIGSLTAQHPDKVIIHSVDSDLEQLLEKGRVKIIKSSRKTKDIRPNQWIATTPFIFNWDMFVEKYGFEPTSFIDYRVMVGDSSDRISGLDGFGPKIGTSIVVWLDENGVDLTDLPDEHHLNKRQLTSWKQRKHLIPLFRGLLTVATDLQVPNWIKSELEAV